MSAPLWVSVEGINGVGKTEAVHRAARLLGPACLRLDEVTDQDSDTLPGRVIAAMAAGGDEFLRGGHPVAETFALMALRVREYERVHAHLPTGIRLVLEDRGVDTVVAYQAAILAAMPAVDGGECGGLDELALARRIKQMATRWRPAPHTTVLLLDDQATCIARFARRLGVPVSSADRELIGHAARLYTTLAEAEPGRFHPLPVGGNTADQTADALADLCHRLLEEREAVDA